MRYRVRVWGIRPYGKEHYSRWYDDWFTANEMGNILVEFYGGLGYDIQDSFGNCSWG